MNRYLPANGNSLNNKKKKVILIEDHASADEKEVIVTVLPLWHKSDFCHNAIDIPL